MGCKHCGSGSFVRNGTAPGRQRYRCKAYGRSFTATPPRGKPPAIKALAMKALAVLLYALQLPTSSTSRRGGYSYGFDLRLDPIRLDHLGALKRLSTEELGLEESQQTVDPTGKDVGNCKAHDATF